MKGITKENARGTVRSATRKIRQVTKAATAEKKMLSIGRMEMAGSMKGTFARTSKTAICLRRVAPNEFGTIMRKEGNVVAAVKG